MVTLGLKVTRGDELGEDVMEFDTVPVKETVPLTVCVRVTAIVMELQGDGVKLTVTHPVGVPLLLREEKGEGEKEALPVGLLDVEELPLDMRDAEPLLVTLAGVGDTLIVALPHLLAEEEKEEDLEALVLPLGRRVAEVHNEARGEREDDTVTLELRVALGDALVVVEKDTEGVSETEGVVVGVIEIVNHELALLRELLLPLSVPLTVGEPLGLLDTETVEEVMLLSDKQWVTVAVTQGLLVKEGLAEEETDAVPFGVEDTQTVEE